MHTGKFGKTEVIKGCLQCWRKCLNVWFSEKQNQLSLPLTSRRSAKPRTTCSLLYFSDQQPSISIETAEKPLLNQKNHCFGNSGQLVQTVSHRCDVLRMAHASEQADVPICPNTGLPRSFQASCTDTSPWGSVLLPPTLLEWADGVNCQKA